MNRGECLFKYAPQDEFRMVDTAGSPAGDSSWPHQTSATSSSSDVKECNLLVFLSLS